MYHIYPRSFKDSNGDGIGDLEGIIEKLDYLNDGTPRSLGIGVIWLSPIYKSPLADFGYDISDYTDIESVFGDLATFDRLVEEAHRRNIKVVMDFVLNHTSIEHPWFLESRASKINPKRDWYIWKDPKRDGSPPNNWLSVFGGSAWTFDEKTEQSYLHQFLPEQPDLNWRSPEVREAMFAVMRFWLKRGVDGFRSDAIWHLMKDEKFRDEPPNPAYVPGRDDPYSSLFHIYTQGQPEVFSTADALCDTLEEYDDTFMISEAYISIPEMMKFYRACDNQLHAPFNFHLISLPWKAEVYRQFIDEFEASLAAGDLPNYVLGNHDRSRVATRLGRDRARTAAMLLLTMRGLPVLYYGDEIGMVDVPIPAEEVKDPVEKQVPGLGLGRDPERTPLQWSKEEHAGFSKVAPWLPVAQDYKAYNVEVESNDPRSLLNLYRRIIHYRNSSPALRYGRYSSLDIKQESIFGYLRESDEEKLLVLLNFSEKDQLVSSGEFDRGKIVCNTYLDRDNGEPIDLKTVSLKPYEGLLITVT